MAQQVKVILTCDLDETETEAAETVTFGYNGRQYAMELCEDHLSQFEDVIGSWVSVARDAGRAQSAPARRQRVAARKPISDTSDVRTWAQSNGYAVGDRGRIPQEVREAYETAHGANPPASDGDGEAPARSRRSRKPAAEVA